MYKPVLWILLLLLHASPVWAQDENVLLDTVVTVVQPAGRERSTSVKFDKIREHKPVLVRTIPKSLVDSLKASDDFWYANAAPIKRKAKKEQAIGESIFQKGWFRNLLWVIILSSFIGVVLWYLVVSNIFIFRKNAKTISREEDVAENKDDIFSLDYDKEIAAATAGGNYRLAVRLWYLQTLKTLAERGMIQYRFGRTNQDYVAQLSRHSQYRDFFRLTRNFEYTWYGQFPLSAEAYEMMRHDFVQFQNSIR